MGRKLVSTMSWKNSVMALSRYSKLPFNVNIGVMDRFSKQNHQSAILWNGICEIG